MWKQLHTKKSCSWSSVFSSSSGWRDLTWLWREPDVRSTWGWRGQSTRYCATPLERCPYSSPCFSSSRASVSRSVIGTLVIGCILVGGGWGNWDTRVGKRGQPGQSVRSCRWQGVRGGGWKIQDKAMAGIGVDRDTRRVRLECHGFMFGWSWA